MRHRATALTALAAGAALVATFAVAAVPFLRFAYPAPALHVALETAESLVATVLAFLAVGRHRQSQRTQDLLLGLGLGVLALANLALAALPAALSSTGGERFSRWAPLLVRLSGTALLAAAALVGPARTDGPARARAATAGALATVVVLVGAVLVLGDRLPSAVNAVTDLGPRRSLVAESHPVVFVAQVLTGVLYLVAAVVFARQDGRGVDELVRWLGPACAVAAVARIDYLLFPSPSTAYVSLGDVLRLTSYGLLLHGSAREVRSYWARAAVLEDRRRLARDLHDGLTQELTYIWSQARLLVARPGDQRVAERIEGAAARAIDEARAAIAALTRTQDGSFPDVLRASVDGLAGRYGARGEVVADGAPVLSPEQGDAVLRIVAEAFRNAARHGAASCVRVDLTSPPLLLVVRDDGQGFDPSTANPRGSGFGLTSMRERAEGVGATFVLQSEPGRGTKVEVRWS